MTAAAPRLEFDAIRRQVTLHGAWNLAGITATRVELLPRLAALCSDRQLSWVCSEIEVMDSAGAMALWRAWGHQLPEALVARPDQLRMFERIVAIDKLPQPVDIPRSPFEWIIQLGDLALRVGRNCTDFLVLVGTLLPQVLQVLRNPREIPRKEISANLYKSGVRAMPVTALVGFLIGVVLSYLSALQLKQFGADIFIINILGLGIVRELGPVLTAVLVAGRSGSAMTAQLGVMRVTEEIDALATMGISRTLRLVLPKVAALALAMPLLVLWTSAVALVGGMVSAWMQLDISYGAFFEALPKAVPLANLWIGQAKGLAFGVAVALIACHFGLRVQPNTESLSTNTTASVVTSITAVILLDAVFAIATRGVGVPKF